MSINVTVTETPNVDLTVATATGINLDVNNPTHNSLDGIQGGQQGEYYHLTASQYASLDQPNITTATIVDALGYTPLSTETDDQTLQEILDVTPSATGTINVDAFSGVSGVLDVIQATGDLTLRPLGSDGNGGKLILDGDSFNSALKIENYGQIEWGASTYRFGLSSTYWQWKSWSKPIEIQGGAGTVMYIGTPAGDGNVGIGTNSPTEKLEVVGQSRLGTSNTIVATAAANTLVVESTSSTQGGISILGPNTAYQYLVFGSPSDSLGALARWNYGNSTLEIGTSAASGELIFLAGNSSQKMRITSAGNVGIGTSSPQQKLHVEGTIRIGSDVDLTRYAGQLYTAQNIVLGSQNSETANITVNASTTKSVLGVRRPSSGTTSILKVRDYSTQDLYVDIDSDGNGYFAGKIGIGTTSPLDTLDVKDSNPRVRLIDTSVPNDPAAYMWNSGGSLLFRADVTQARANTYIRFDIDQSEKLRITDGGKVGIGTTNPNNQLDVVGSASIDVLQHQSETTNYWALGASASYQQRVTSRTATAITQVIEGHSSQSADLLQIRSSGASNGNYVTVNSGGNVGIGTNSPSYKLHVNGDTYAQSVSLDAENGGGIYNSTYSDVNILPKSNAFEFNVRTSSNVGKLRVSTDGSLYLASNANAINLGRLYNNIYPKKQLQLSFSGSGYTAFFDRDGVNELMRVDGATGNVGIGTTSPSYKLHVNGNVWGNAIYTNLFSVGNEGKVVSTSTQGLQLQATAGSKPITFYTNVGGNTERMRITHDGNVGIGATSPNTKLHVEGDTPVIQIRETSGTAEAGISMNHSTAGSHYNWFVGTLDGSPRKLTIGATVTNGHSTDTAQSAASLMLIDQSTGNVGIGTPSPSELLTIAAESPTLRFEDISSSNYTEMYVNNFDTYLNTKGRLFIQNQGSTKVAVNSNGNVGIGTTSPSWKLHVNSTTRAAILGNGTPWKSDGVAYIGSYYGTHTPLLVDHHNASTNSSNFAEFRNGDDDIAIKLKADGSADFAGDLAVSGGDITLDGTATSTFTIDTSNSFGRELTLSTNGILPTISANSDLLIKTSNSHTQIKLEGGGSTDNIQFVANQFEQVRITTAGVGIGTTAPDSKLHVVGSVDSDAASLGSEIVASQTASGTNWSGSSIATGYTHSAGSTDLLVSNLTPIVNRLYRVEIQTTNVTAGRLDKVSFGGIEQTVYITNNTTRVLSLKATSTGPLTFQCQSAFVGTVTVSSVKEIVASDSLSVLTNSGGSGRLETRVFSSTDFFLGDFAGENRVSSGGNIGIGYEALRRIATAGINLAIGNGSLSNLVNGSYNVAIGHDILGNYQKSGNVYNIGIGNNVMDGSSITGTQNIIMGFWAGADMTSAGSNLGIGYSVFGDLTSGSGNLSLGNNSLTNATSGGSNIALGVSALQSLTTTSQNIAIGYLAGRYAIGNAANETPSSSIYIGYNTKAAANGETNQIVIGANAEGIGANTVTLGNDSVVTTALKGDVGIGTTSPSAKLHAYQTISTVPSIVSRVPYKTNADSQLKQRAALRIDINEGGSSLSIGGIGSAHGGFIQSYSTNSTSTYRNFVLNPFGGNVGIGFGVSAAPTEKLDVAGNIKASGFINYAAKTVAETNAMTGMVAGSSVYVTDETGGSVMATYDGTNWRRSTDRAIIS